MGRLGGTRFSVVSFAEPGGAKRRHLLSETAWCTARQSRHHTDPRYLPLTSPADLPKQGYGPPSATDFAASRRLPTRVRTYREESRVLDLATEPAIRRSGGPHAAGQFLHLREPRTHLPRTQSPKEPRLRGVLLGDDRPKSVSQPNCCRPGVKSACATTTTINTTARLDGSTPTCSVRAPHVINCCEGGLDCPPPTTSR